MTEMTRVHSCKTGEIVDRPRTREEQASVDAARAEWAKIEAPADQPTASELYDALRRKGLLSESDLSR